MKAKITNTGVKIGKSMVTKDGCQVNTEDEDLPVNNIDKVNIISDGINISSSVNG